MSDETDTAIGCGCILAIALASFATVVFTIAAAAKWVLS